MGPGGIFLVAVRDRPGPAYALRRADDTVACSTAADVVAEMAGAYARRVRPVLCILGDAELLEQALDVLVCSTATLIAALTSAPVVLSGTQADEAVALLGGAPDEKTAPVAPTVEPAVAPVPVPLGEAPRGKRARAVEPDAEPILVAESFAAEAPRGKRARAVEPEEPALPPISVPLIRERPAPRPEAVPVAAPVVETVPDEAAEAADPVEPGPDEVEPGKVLTGRAKRVAEAMATRDAQAAKVAVLQGQDGSAAAAKPKGTGTVGKLVKLLVAAAVVGVLALNGPHLVTTAGTWGPGLWAQLNGKSGSASACAPASVATSAAPLAEVDVEGQPEEGHREEEQDQGGRKAEARKKKRQREAAAAARTQALESPVC